MSNEPLVSIILPVYNGQKYLAEAIDSCLCQNFSNFELIIVNDASTDKSLQIAESFAKNDKRIQIITNGVNLKLPRSLNIGHRYSNGEFVTWTSDDNLLKPDFLEIILDEFRLLKYDIIFTDFDIIWGNGKLKRKHKAGPLEEIIFGDIIGASFLYKREVFEGLKGYNEDLFLVEDYDFFLRASLKYRIGYINKSLYKYRLHDNSLTSNISNELKYSLEHKSGLKKMYQNFQNEIKINTRTIDTIVALYFHEHIAIKNYLPNNEIIKRDILKYYGFAKNSLKINTDILSNKIFWNWYSNRKDQTLINLLKVIIHDRSILFNEKNNRNAVIQIIVNCINPFKKI